MNLRFLLIGVATAATSFCSQAKLVINEVMQSNIDCYYTQNEFPDSWVELYNDGTQSEVIRDYALGITENYEEAWHIDASTPVAPKGYSMVLCDKEATGRHTHFRIDSGKGTVYLFNKDGEIVDKVTLKKMLAPNTSFGRETDGASTWGHQITPTPNAANTGGTSEELLPDPVFNIPSQLCSSSVQVKISAPKDVELPDDTKLCITTDGTEPTIANAYPNLAKAFNVTKTTVFRAKFISSKAITARSVANSYIFHPRAVTLPIVSMVIDEAYLTDSSKGIYNHTDHDWRRPLNFIYFPLGETEAVVNQLGETRISGAYSRSLAQKSHIIYANKRFGVKRLDYPFWKDKPGVSADIKSLLLRNSGNDWNRSHICDAFIQTIFGRNVDNLDWQAYQPVIYYVNGAYKGIIDLRERANEDYVAANFNGLEDVCLLENYSMKEGEWIDHYPLFLTITNPDVTYEELCNVIDEEEFMNMFIVQSYSANTDYPQNNDVFWLDCRPGGKWRWILKDMDFYGYENAYNYKYFDYILHTGSYANATKNVKAYQAFMRQPEFKKKFLDHYCVYLGDFLKDECIKSLYAEMQAEIEPEFEAFLAVYNYPTTVASWKNKIQNLITWTTQRNAFMWNYLHDYFSLGTKVSLTINCNEKEVSINDITLREPTYKGNWYAGREFTVSTPEENWGWHMKATTTSGKTENKDFEQHTLSINVGDYKSIQLEPYQFTNPSNSIPSSDVVSIKTDGNNVTLGANDEIQSVTIYDATGRQVTSYTSVAGTSAELEMPGTGIFIVKITTPQGTITKKVAL